MLRINLGDIELPREVRYNNLSLKNKLLFKFHNKKLNVNPRHCNIFKNSSYPKHIHLRFDLLGQYYEGDSDLHPSEELKSLGIKYIKWIPQTTADQIWLLYCTNIPKELPTYIEKLELSKEHLKHCV